LGNGGEVILACVLDFSDGAMFSEPFDATRDLLRGFFPVDAYG